MSNHLKGLTDRGGNVYGTKDKVERHSGGWSLNGSGSHSKTEIRSKIINR